VNFHDYLNAQQQGGRRHSRGTFTVSPSWARAKLASRQLSDPYAYLWLLVSAGFGYGGTAIDVTETRDTLSVEIPGAYFAYDALMGSLDSILSGSGDQNAIDLILALQGALRCDIKHVRVEVKHPTKASYVLNAFPQDSHVSPRRGAVETASVTVTLRREPAGLLERLRTRWRTRRYDYDPGPACLLVESKARWSQRPVCINRTPLCRTSGLSQLLKSEDGCWTARVQLESGFLTCVVNGIAYPGVPHANLSGIIWTEGLRRDISREQIVQDAAYESLLAQVERELEAAALRKRNQQLAEEQRLVAARVPPAPHHVRELFGPGEREWDPRWEHRNHCQPLYFLTADEQGDNT
jgi:hypothetical protein